MKSRQFFFYHTLLLGLLFLSPGAFAQVTTVGKEFWVGFMENHRVNNGIDAAVIVISANEAASGTIDLSRIQPGRIETFNLAAGQNYTLKLPSNIQDFLHRTSGVIEQKGIFISADGNISVYAFNERYRSADGTVVLPLQSLGKDYFVTSHFEVTQSSTNQSLNSNNESLMLVMAIEDNTQVQITPSVNTEDGKLGGNPFTITLNEGQSYQLKARGDLTGSRVTVIGAETSDCKNIVVFGGNKWTGVGQCGSANDHLFQQMYPINAWGSEFIHIPFAFRTSGELVKVLAAENNTQVFIDGNAVDILNTGEFKTYDFNSTDIKEIKTSKPSSVTAFAKSQACNIPGLASSNQGDPFMLLYSPNEQMLQSITFEAMDVVAIETNFVSVLVKTASKGKTFLDGQNIGNLLNPVPVNPEYSYAIVQISGGSHTLSNPDGFIGYVYGFGNLESYGYSVGASLNNLNFEVKGEYEFDVQGERVACLEEEGIWEVIPENENFTFFLWDFGDGSAFKEGKEVTHTYLKPGKFTVKIIASISENSCDSQEDVIFELEVLDITGVIAGADMVCPFVEEIWYEGVDLQSVEKIEWSVSGGEIIEREDLRVLVRWGEPNNQALVTGIPYGPNGCPGKPLEFEVKINQNIEPKKPKGDTIICFDPNNIYVYEVDLILDNRGYFWYIEGGEIISSNELATLEVKWNQPGVIGKLWYREYSLNDELCEGTSDELVITVNTAIELSLESQTDINCNGESTGRISLKLEGGTGTYTMVWSHQAGLNTLQGNNLKAGIYTITAIDGFGCEASLEVTLTEPPLFEAALISTEMTSCFGREDGRARISLSGGSPPYRYDGEDYALNGQDLIISSLAMGSRTITLYDAVNCQVRLTFDIDSPLPLVADVRLIKQACPGESNGELLVVPSGGVSPYVFTWDYLQSEGEELVGVPRGEYTATIVDAAGCISFGSGLVPEEAPKMRMPSGFRPSDGGVNSVYEGVSNCGLDFHLSVYNRWGELIYSGTQGWDGKINEVEVMPDVYTYIIKYSYFMDGQTWVKESKGLFTLVR